MNQMAQASRRVVVSLAILAVISHVTTSCGYAQPGADSAWWAHIRALASDDLRGRRTGTDDYRRAAAYVAAAYREIGADSLGPAGYFQEVPFVARTVDEPRCEVTLLPTEGSPIRLRMGDDLTLQKGASLDRDLTADLVFVGYGVVAPEAKYDDLEWQDLKGKIAVYVSAGPKAVPDPLRAHIQFAAERWARLRAAGAIGALSIPNPATMEAGWGRYVANRGLPGMALDDKADHELTGQRFGGRINPARADSLFEGSQHTWEEIAALAKRGDALPTFDMPMRLRAHVEAKTWRVRSPNVIGVIHGSDPALRDEYVLVTAHLDHLGVGAPVDGDSIYNGAMDNASGVATLLEVARALRKGPAPKRSVIIAALTGEEEGLYGSAYFALHPLVPMARIVAELNVDMVLPIVPLERMVVFGLNESTLGPRATEIARRHGVETQKDPEPQRNLFIRSDQYNLIRAGVPSLSFVTGYEPGTKADETLKKWRHERYHAPSDDLDQPVDHAAAALWNEILLDLVRDTADGVEKPRWNADSFFARFAKPPAKNSSRAARP
jgi:Zn-dependent M28 family amino/carboxypeptidase